MPVPDRATVCGLPAASSAMLRVAARAVAALGAKRTPTTHDAPAGMLPTHVLNVTAKSPGLAPVMVTLVMVVRALPPLFVTVTCWLSEAVPTCCGPNVKLVGAMLACGAPGAGAATVRVTVLDVPPPGPGVTTFSGNCPAVASCAAGTTAVRWVSSTRAVARATPSRYATVPAFGAKPVPVSVTVVSPVPAGMAAGLTASRIGAGAVTAKLRATCGAGAYAALPAWLAAMVQIPAPTRVTVAPFVLPVVQTAAVLDVKVTGLPDAPPVALTAKGAPP